MFLASGLMFHTIVILMDRTQTSNIIFCCWPRRDKYERKVFEYYIETSTLVSFTDELAESTQQQFSGECQEVPALMSGVDGPGPDMEMSGGEGGSEDDEGGDDEQLSPEGISTSESEGEEKQKGPSKRRKPDLKEEPCEEENNSCSKTCQLNSCLLFKGVYYHQPNPKGD